MEPHDKKAPATTDLISHTAQIVAGYASHHTVADLPALIRQVHATLAGLSGGDGIHKTVSAREPAVQVSK